MINNINNKYEGSLEHRMLDEALDIKCELMKLNNKEGNFNRQCKSMGKLFFDNGCFDEYKYKKLCKQIGINLKRYKDNRGYVNIVVLRDSIDVATTCLLQCLHIDYKNMNGGEKKIFEGVRGGFYLNCALGSFFDGHDEFTYND